MRILMVRSLDSHGPNVFVASHLKESLGRWYRLEAQLSKKGLDGFVWRCDIQKFTRP